MERFDQLELSNIQNLAQKLVELLSQYPCLALNGDLGTGKTTLTMAILQALGIERPEGSPTFSIIQPYLLPDGKTLYHIDAYRIKNAEEAFQLGLEELFTENAYFVVEWPEIISNFLPEVRMKLTIEYSKSNHRNYTLEYGH
ncbi:MAG: tRNA (adenosine(37)-N6)-threonylcarbamoyltransferase complex ATPase subunit type 1 TsaE [Bacteroidota bacterium]